MPQSFGMMLSQIGLASPNPDSRLRPRRKGQSDREFLMGDSFRTHFSCQFGCPGLTVHMENSAAAADSFSLDQPPRLAWDGISAGWGLLGSTLTGMLMPDIVIRPTPVVIAAPPEYVWRVLLDFERYKEWNPFHRDVRVVDQPGGTVAVSLTVDMGELLGTLVSEETVYYVDEKRCILAYGIGRKGPACLRAVWLVPTANGGTIFNSWDTIGGVPALLSRGHIHRTVVRGFEAQHLAIRERVHSLRYAEASRGTSDRSDVSAAHVAPEPLAVCVVTGGCGFLGAHIVRLLCLLDGVSSVHVIDVQLPRPDSGLPMAANGCKWRGGGKVEVHQMSITDTPALDELFTHIRPTTVFHTASLIDLREDAASHAALEHVNVDGTRALLALAAQHGATRFVYTSSIECTYAYNRSVQVDEEEPYSAHPTNGYQRTKVAAERLVLEANSASMATVSVRPAHIVGDPLEDDLRFLSGVQACFSEELSLPSLDVQGKSAKMSMVHVENCALLHVLAAAKCRIGARPVRSVAGRKFNATDFDENIVCIYHALAGSPGPWIVLPSWLLFLLVHAALWLHWLAGWASSGSVKLLPPKTGLHHGALAASKECTLSGRRARQVFGYEPIVSREGGIKAAAQSREAALLRATGATGAKGSAARRPVYMIGKLELCKALGYPLVIGSPSGSPMTRPHDPSR